MEGIPKVFLHRPVPLRDEPLPGTKSMNFPTDRPLQVSLTPDDPSGRQNDPSPSGDWLGGIAIFVSICGLALVWLGWLTPWSGPLFWISVALTHLLAVFSHIFPGHTLRGGWAIIILYGGCLLSAAISWLLK